MKPMTFKRSRFKLKKFLDALHKFSVENLGNGDPLPVVCGETAYYDPVDLAEALADEGEEEIEIPDHSWWEKLYLTRLKLAHLQRFGS